MARKDERRPFGKGGDARADTRNTTNDQSRPTKTSPTDSLVLNYAPCQDDLATMAAMLAETFGGKFRAGAGN